MTITYRNDLAEIDWPELKTALAADQFDNGRKAEQLRRSFENSQAVEFKRLNAKGRRREEAGKEVKRQKTEEVRRRKLQIPRSGRSSFGLQSSIF